MITWICRGAAALSLLGVLGACDALDPDSTLSEALASPADAAATAVPLKQALMMRGKVTLVPPGGFCIDPDSLSESFALMARCDALGAAAGGSGAPIGVMTVSFSRTINTIPLPTAQEFTAAAGLDAPADTRTSASGMIFKTRSAPPADDLSPEHWRGVSKIGDFTMSAALFGPEGRRAVSDEGADLLGEMMQRTIDKTNAG